MPRNIYILRSSNCSRTSLQTLLFLFLLNMFGADMRCFAFAGESFGQSSERIVLHTFYAVRVCASWHLDVNSCSYDMHNMSCERSLEPIEAVTSCDGSCLFYKDSKNLTTVPKNISI